VEPTIAREAIPPGAWFAARSNREEDRDDSARAGLAETARHDKDPLEPNKLRGEIVDRLRLVARRHARHQADRRWRGEFPLARHVVVFFYREPGPSDVYGLVRVATRLEKDGAEVADPYGFVTQLHDLALEYVSRGKFDPRTHLANRAEPDMSSEAAYVGLGVTTLDPDDVALHMPEDVYSDERPFRGIALLYDDTRLVVRWNGGLEPVRTQTTHTLDAGGASTRIWEYLPQGALHPSATEAGRIASAIAGLHELIVQHYYPAGPNAAGTARPPTTPGAHASGALRR
jgi:hypothetical protein